MSAGLDSPYLNWLGRSLPASVDPVTGAAPIVLGYATGYDPADVAVFVRSLRSVYDGEAILVVDDRPDMRAFLAEHRIEAVLPNSEAGWKPHPVVARLAAFDCLLAARPHIGAVFMTDVRDVVFQESPFQPSPVELEVYIEADEPLAAHAFNMKHLRAVFGDRLAENLSGQPCICVGTILGPAGSVRAFCRTLLMLGAGPRSSIGGAFGADQATCNFAVHMGLSTARVRPNYGRVATLGLTPASRVKVENGLIVTLEGGPSPVVHQYDRHPHLLTYVHARWGGGLEKRERVRSLTVEDRVAKLKASVARRWPEVR